MIALACLTGAACGRRAYPSAPDATPSHTNEPASIDARTVGVVDARDLDVGPADHARPTADSGDAARPTPAIRTVPFAEDRSAFVVMPRLPTHAPRLLAAIHGVCTPPSYVCGEWQNAASDKGLLVCPTGNSSCGPDGTGGPTWEGPFSGIDTDLELSIEAVRRQLAPSLTHDGAVLVGYSRGGYVAVITAVRHPGRWPFLIVNEADVDLTVPMLRGAGVRAVALIAGEWGTQLAGERRTAAALMAEGYPARVWVMGKTGHPYSTDIDAIMQEALDFVLSQEATPAPHDP